jgi:hypothetical protein
MLEASATNTNSLISLVSRGDTDHELEQRRSQIRFLCIPDGLPPDHGRFSKVAEYMLAVQKMGPALEQLLRSRSSTDDGKYSFPPITCIVTDAFKSCTEQVATNMKVPRVIFWPLCAASSICQLYANFLMSEGHIPVKSKHVTPSPPMLLIATLFSFLVPFDSYFGFGYGYESGLMICDN